MNREEFRAIAPSLPHQPGCYKYYDAERKLLYVGKAKDIRKRVSSYFSKTQDNYKTRKLVSLIQFIEYTATDTEHDAFLLENSLIKHYQPKFNIDLKDDKTYPYVVIKKEAFPRVFITRRVIRDGSEYLGPFTQVWNVRELLQLIKENLPLRTCNLNLSPANIAKGKYKVCLEYHLGNCKGPCEGLQTEAEYAENLQQVRHILKGNTGEVIRFLKKEMVVHSDQMAYEKAEVIRQKIVALQQYQSHSTIVNPRLGNLDVAVLLTSDERCFVHYMMVSNGSVVYAHTIEARKKLEETDEEVLSFVLQHMRELSGSQAMEVIVPFPIMLADTTLKQTVPRAGDKKKLLELSWKNVKLFYDEVRRKDSLLIGKPTDASVRETLERVQQALRLPVIPVHIECFDNSNFQGAYPVAAMVCYKNGRPSKKDYRHFHIKTVEGINDFASMSEIIYRRYKRIADHPESLPQLIIIDGGKGQLSAAMESIQQLGLAGKMTVVGLAKREESLFFPEDSVPLQLAYDDPAHLFIRSIRDEVHRFGITFHRQIRSKGTFTNELESIPGIGTQTATALLKAFRSVNNIRQLTERELTRVAGAAKARLVYAYFHTEET